MANGKRRTNDGRTTLKFEVVVVVVVVVGGGGGCDANNDTDTNAALKQAE